MAITSFAFNAFSWAKKASPPSRLLLAIIFFCDGSQSSAAVGPSNFSLLPRGWRLPEEAVGLLQNPLVEEQIRVVTGNERSGDTPSKMTSSFNASDCELHLPH